MNGSPISRCVAPPGQSEHQSIISQKSIKEASKKGSDSLARLRIDQASVKDSKYVTVFMSVVHYDLTRDSGSPGGAGRSQEYFVAFHDKSKLV